MAGSITVNSCAAFRPSAGITMRRVAAAAAGYRQQQATSRRRLIIAGAAAQAKSKPSLALFVTGLGVSGGVCYTLLSQSELPPVSTAYARVGRAVMRMKKF